MAALSVSTTHACALGERGDLWCWGSYPAIGFEPGDTCEDLADVPLPRGASVPHSSPARSDRCAKQPSRLPIEGVVEVATGGVTCARLSDGTVRCWGRASNGMLGWEGAEGTVLAADARPVSAVEGARHVAVGYSHACAVVADGEVVCWGRHVDGQLGLGVEKGAPEIQPPSRVPGLRGVKQLALAWRASCALHEDGTVWCWGRGATGLGADRCGDEPGAAPCSLRPTRLAAVRDAVQLDTSGSLSCALRRDGGVLCWDDGSLGRTGYVPGSREPTPVAGLTNVRQIAVLLSGLCALGADGHVRCLGLNIDGQRGNGTTGYGDDGAVTEVLGISNAAEVSAGNFSACARTSEGHVFCWGRNGSGQLGDGSMDRRTMPVRTF